MKKVWLVLFTILALLMSGAPLVLAQEKQELSQNITTEAVSAASLLEKPTLIGKWEADLPEGAAALVVTQLSYQNFVGTHEVRDPTKGVTEAYPLKGKTEGRQIFFTLYPSGSTGIQYHFMWDGVDILKGGPIGAEERVYQRKLPFLR